jgi:cytochrome d ubiquinol oxidase subunit II
MSSVAFWILAAMLTIYVLLDGYDLGVAAIAPLVARTDAERAAAMQSIGPFWNGNEVWLIAAGGSLFALFPQAYASAFSGFYLPFMVVLWMLMFRGIALELRGHLPSELWHTFWDFCFTASSVLLVALFGVALGNIVRGLPLGRDGYFLGTFTFLLNPYALGVAMLAIAALAQHGASFLLTRIEGLPATRSHRLAARLWWIVVALYATVSVWTLAQRGSLGQHAMHAWPIALPVASLCALLAFRLLLWRGAYLWAFVASAAFLTTLLVAAAGTIYPYILPGFPSAQSGLSIDAFAPSPPAFFTSIGVLAVGLCIVIAYTIVVWRNFKGKISV